MTVYTRHLSTGEPQTGGSLGSLGSPLSQFSQLFLGHVINSQKFIN